MKIILGQLQCFRVIEGLRPIGPFSRPPVTTSIGGRGGHVQQFRQCGRIRAGRAMLVNGINRRHGETPGFENHAGGLHVVHSAPVTFPTQQGRPPICLIALVVTPGDADLVEGDFSD